MPGGINPPPDVVNSWPTPSTNPETRSWLYPAVVIALFGLAVVIVLARLWTRLFLRGKKGLDDLFISIAMIPLGLMVAAIVGALRAWGFNKHVWDTAPQDGVLGRKITLCIEILFLYASGFTKVSILLFYRRLSKGLLSNAFEWTVLLAIAFVVLGTIGFSVTLLLGCHPIDAFWNQVDMDWAHTHEDGVDYYCFNEHAGYLAAAGVNISQDLLACFLPSVIFWKLSMPTRTKIALGSLFFVGFFTCICSGIRILYIYEIFYTTYDVTWVGGTAWLWTGIEANLGVICASVPSLRTYFQRDFYASPAYTDTSFGISSPSPGNLGAVAAIGPASRRYGGDPRLHAIDEDYLATNQSFHAELEYSRNKHMPPNGMDMEDTLSSSVIDLDMELGELSRRSSDSEILNFEASSDRLARIAAADNAASIIIRENQSQDSNTPFAHTQYPVPEIPHYPPSFSTFHSPSNSLSLSRPHTSNSQRNFSLPMRAQSIKAFVEHST